MTKRKGLLISVLLIFSILLFTACGTTKEKGNAEESTDTITIQHSLGETKVDKNPKRVVVFDYGTLDSLDKMNVEIVGLPKANIPSSLEKFNDDKYENVGALKEPDFEKIFELQPDIIFISGRQAESYEEFEKIAPTVYMEVDGADYMGSVIKNAKILGEIFDKEEFVEQELANINDAIQELNQEVVDSEKNALIVLANDGMISAYGEGSRFGIIHREFGFIPVDKGIEVSNHGQSITFEYILEKNPDVVFVVDRAAVTGGSTSAKQIFDNDIIKQTEAYKNGKIVYLNSEIWYVASGGLTGTKTMIEDVQSNF
ncbi:siderophore ABC transporter substrate-binding protein [Irregularibacter muris]|uniref:Siderophore ABC transporter substrate-binding protein n=1 Tax=Irregularibacter muris TaxID=1796619 RepID=A0AAE3HFH6_9FIRM|nr:siderophore ABC transporter substrate-binding protein [Irregularibacter muris]MCR1899631.1 siderophore ABC transporter substrate-binding protein [Irregularibacter muris]